MSMIQPGRETRAGSSSAQRRRPFSSVNRLLVSLVPLVAALAFACAPAPAPEADSAAEQAGEPTGPAREYYEIRRYRLADEDSRQTVLAYLENALVPALNRAGIDRVGVFGVEPDPAEEEAPDPVDAMSVWTIIAFSGIDDFTGMKATLEADADYLEAAAPMYATPVREPIYERVESWFLHAFQGMPVMELPAQTAAGEDRIFELRLYESHNEDTARRKVHMFDNGEIDIMRDVDMAPLLYGELLIGANVPALVYILSAPDMESHQEHWEAFLEHPDWERMSGMEMYKGTVSGIEKVFLRPTAFSRI